MAERLVAARVPELFEKHCAMEQSGKIVRTQTEAALDCIKGAAQVSPRPPHRRQLKPQRRIASGGPDLLLEQLARGSEVARSSRSVSLFLSAIHTHCGG
jgi:hypothetical protein